MAKGHFTRGPHEADEDDHDGELWLVSYADMVTLLFGFFVILFSFSTLDDKKFDQMTQKMAETFQAKEEKKTSDSDVGVSAETRQLRALQMLVAMLNLGDSVDDAVAKIEKTYAEGKNAEGTVAVLSDKAEGHKGLVKAVKETKDDAVHTVDLMLPDSSLFAAGAYRLTPEATVKLKALAGDLRQAEGLTEIEVAGHTDGQPPAPGAAYDNNFTLSALRAGAVAAALIRFGVDDKKLTVRGMGSLRPLAPERGQDGHLIPGNLAKNRRVNIVLKVRNAHGPTSH